MIVAVWARADDQPFERRRSPVAIERPEKQLAEPPPRVHVRLGGPPRDEAVLLAVVIRIVLESRVEVRVGDDRNGAEQRLDREPAGGGRVSRSGGPQRVTPRVTRARRCHVAVCPRPRLAVGGRASPGGPNGAPPLSPGAPQPGGVGGGQGAPDGGLRG